MQEVSLSTRKARPIPPPKLPTLPTFHLPPNHAQKTSSSAASTSTVESTKYNCLGDGSLVQNDGKKKKKKKKKWVDWGKRGDGGKRRGLEYLPTMDEVVNKEVKKRVGSLNIGQEVAVTIRQDTAKTR